MTDMTAEQALDAVRNVLQRAYNSADPVCCGRAGTECCGSPEPEWSEYDQQIMNDLQPVEEYLSKVLTAPRVPEGFEIKRSPDGSIRVSWKKDGSHKSIWCNPEGSEESPMEDMGESMLWLLADALLTAAQSPAEPAQDELAKLRERVKELESYFHKMIGVPASVGVCEPIEGYVERPGDAVDAMREMSARLRGGSDE